ncbi:MAG: NUDIX domain-containing protein [Planctomycetes bacterium]|nr:NUDIX domain-containing protein [Planctomycetota bacterium]
MSRSVDLFLGENPASSVADLTALRALAALRGKVRHSAPRVPRDLAAPLIAEQIVETWRRRRPRSLRLPLWPEALARVPGFGGREEVEAILRHLPPPSRVRVLDGAPLGSLATLFPDSWRALAPRYERALRDLARERRWEPIEVVDAFLLDGDRLLLDLRPRSAPCYAGMWDTPGGKLEPGEDIAGALRRELREEIGVSARRTTVLQRIDHRDSTSGRLFRHWLCVVRSWDGRIRAREGQTLRWIRLRELRALSRLNPVVRRAFEASLV